MESISKEEQLIMFKKINKLDLKDVQKKWIFYMVSTVLTKPQRERILNTLCAHVDELKKIDFAIVDKVSTCEYCHKPSTHSLKTIVLNKNFLMDLCEEHLSFLYDISMKFLD